MKRTICLILAAILCIGLLAGCGGSDGDSDTGSGKSGDNDSSTTLTSFDVMYTREGIEDFLNMVCRNIDAESAKVKSVRATPYGTYEKIFEATLEIKVAGKAPQEVILQFYNDSRHSSRDVCDSEKVERIEVDTFSYSGDYDTEYKCGRAVVLGLEKALGGGKAEQFLKPYDEMDSSFIDGNWNYTSYDSGTVYWHTDYWVCNTARSFPSVRFDDYNVIRIEYSLEKDDRA